MQMKTTTYTGTGSAVVVQLGFKPRALIIHNYTDGDAVYHWSDTMTDATAIGVTTAAAAVSSGGVTPYAGTIAANAQGFTAGANLSESAKVFHVVAFG